jgi:hypothetical protein
MNRVSRQTTQTKGRRKKPGATTPQVGESHLPRTKRAPTEETNGKRGVDRHGEPATKSGGGRGRRPPLVAVAGELEPDEPPRSNQGGRDRGIVSMAVGGPTHVPHVGPATVVEPALTKEQASMLDPACRFHTSGACGGPEDHRVLPPVGLCSLDLSPVGFFCAPCLNDVRYRTSAGAWQHITEERFKARARGPWPETEVRPDGARVCPLPPLQEKAESPPIINASDAESWIGHRPTPAVETFPRFRKNSITPCSQRVYASKSRCGRDLRLTPSVSLLLIHYGGVNDGLHDGLRE